MKKIFIILSCFFLMGCATIQNNPTVVPIAIDSLAKAAGQIFGYKFAQNNPDMIPDSLVMWNSLASDTLTQTQIANDLAIISKQTNTDPLLAISLKNILDLVTIVTDNKINAYDNVYIKVAAAGVVEGIQLYQQTVAQQGTQNAKLFKH